MNNTNLKLAERYDSPYVNVTPILMEGVLCVSDCVMGTQKYESEDVWNL